MNYANGRPLTENLLNGLYNDFNSLMNVVVKIEELGYNVVIENDFISIKITTESPKIYEYAVGFKKRMITKENALLIVCTEFVRFYNLHLKTK